MSADAKAESEPAEEHEEARLERLAREEGEARQEHYQALHDESAAMEELRLEQLVADQSVHEEKDAADEEAEDATDAMAGLVPRSGPNGTPRLSPAVRATDLPDLAPLEPADRQMTEREKARASSWLFVCSLSQSLCSNISLQAKNQMFLDYFAGDFAAHARVMTTLSSVSAIVGFFLKPLFASMTDKYGRKPLLALSPILQSANFFAIALCPMSWIITTLMVQQVLQSFTWETSRIASDAAYGDMYSTQPKQLSKMLARQMITWPITSIVCPLIGGYLSTIHLRLPLAVSAVIHALAAVLVVPRVPGKR